MTPPALYRYFENKYAVLAALGKRLLDRQNEVLYAWLDTYSPKGLRAMGEATEELLLRTHEVTHSQPGAIWTLRALRAVPQLAQVRIDSHREAADRMVKAYAPLLPDMSPDVLWRRVRISIELGYSADEMLFEEGRLEVSDIIKDTAAVLRHALLP
jgi:AcrR family transcriptional regulator